jgi:hypothetical protein
MANQPQDDLTMVQTGVRLPAKMLDRLKKSPIGVSGEIRWSVTRLFDDEDNFDEQTRNLGEMAKWIAREVYLQTGVHWYERPEAAASAMAGIQAWVGMARYPAESSSELFPDDPATLGRAIARSYFRIKEEMAKPEIGEVRAELLRATGAAKAKPQEGKS